MAMLPFQMMGGIIRLGTGISRSGLLIVGDIGLFISSSTVGDKGAWLLGGELSAESDGRRYEEETDAGCRLSEVLK